MSGQKFTGLFKSFDALTVATQPIAKAKDAAPAKLPTPIHRHFEAQNLAKSLRKEIAGGFFKAVRDARYDDAVVAALAKSGATNNQTRLFLESDAGAQLGSNLHGTMTKCLGLGAMVKKSFAGWQEAGKEAMAKTLPIRKSATELVAKYGTSDGARKAAETRRSYGQPSQTESQIGAEERRYDGPKPTREQSQELDAKEAESRKQSEATIAAHPPGWTDKLVADASSKRESDRLAFEDKVRRGLA